MKDTAALIAFLAVICTVSAQLVLSRASSPKITSLSDIANMLDLNGTRVDWPDIMYFPDDNGEPRAGNINGRAPLEAVQKSEIFFKLFTRDGPNRGTIIPPGDLDALNQSTFNASEPTYIITHGFIQSIESKTVKTLKNMYLAYTRGNVFAVDWSKISMNPLYFIVKMQSPRVGQFMATFVTFLVNRAGVDVANIHLSGYSLGAHVMGIAGKNIYVILGKKVGRITGLDPAGPLYNVLEKQNRLDRDDADFVDVIHTCGGWLGMYPAIGHVDFYPNGGTLMQPGCTWDLGTAGICSHDRSWVYFAESIYSLMFSSTKCSTYANYRFNNCNQSPKEPMGHHTPHHNRGNYYLKTGKLSPYALG